MIQKLFKEQQQKIIKKTAKPKPKTPSQKKKKLKSPKCRKALHVFHLDGFFQRILG